MSTYGPLTSAAQVTVCCNSADFEADESGQVNVPLDWMRQSKAKPEGHGLRSFIAAPIYVGAEVVGVLTLADVQDRGFSCESDR